MEATQLWIQSCHRAHARDRRPVPLHVWSAEHPTHPKPHPGFLGSACSHLVGALTQIPITQELVFRSACSSKKREAGTGSSCPRASGPVGRPRDMPSPLKQTQSCDDFKRKISECEGMLHEDKYIA